MVAFILIVVIAVCLKRQCRFTTDKRAMLHGTQNEGGKEDNDLKSFQNDAVCTKEEIKLEA